MEYPLGSDTIINYFVSLPYVYLTSVNQYGNYSITLTNSNWSTTTTFQVLPPGQSAEIYSMFLLLPLFKLLFLWIMRHTDITKL